MGCIKTRRAGYTDHIQADESELRTFEEEELKAFRKPLGTIVHRGIIEQDIISSSSIEEMARQEFSEAFVQFLQQGYFYTQVNEKKFYDAQKIKLLLFLIGGNIVIRNGEKAYHDKAGFLFTLVKTRGDEDLVGPIDKENDNLFNFIQGLVEISCVGMVEAFLKMKKFKRENLSKLLMVSKEKITEEIIEFIFSYRADKNAPGNVLLFDDLNRVFREVNYFLTSGFIRDFAWKLVVDGKIDPGKKTNPKVEGQLLDLENKEKQK